MEVKPPHGSLRQDSLSRPTDHEEVRLSVHDLQLPASVMVRGALCGEPCKRSALPPTSPPFATPSPAPLQAQTSLQTEAPRGSTGALEMHSNSAYVPSAPPDFDPALPPLRHSREHHTLASSLGLAVITENGVLGASPMVKPLQVRPRLDPLPSRLGYRPEDRSIASAVPSSWTQCRWRAPAPTSHPKGPSEPRAQQPARARCCIQARARVGVRSLGQGRE